ncbi:hypothetical protein [Methylobacterium sp. Leaf89]|uniref:hypothetical protein n=1 Tax=Methylobacterium sp. Leaf89 TaxID=1736245 RepID=UPI0012E98A35|nr:hypothetical protein [Methylobacterium sp. Leaf89]
MIRDDLSSKLIHLTKGEPEAALHNLLDILRDQALKGGTGYIMGAHQCVCLSEAPISKIGHLIANGFPRFKYRPYGVMFDKKWVYEQGGLPVIYQPAREYDVLPEEKKHLHVTYDLSGDAPVDFTWEREWRLKTDKMTFNPEDVTVIIPNRWVLNTIREVYVGDKPDPLHYLVLEDLGIHVDHGLF